MAFAAACDCQQEVYTHMHLYLCRKKCYRQFVVLHIRHCCLLCTHTHTHTHTCQLLMLAAYAWRQVHAAAHFIHARICLDCRSDELASSQDAECLSLFRGAQMWLMTLEQLFWYRSAGAVAYLVRTKKQADASIVRPVIKLRRPAPV